MTPGGWESSQLDFGAHDRHRPLVPESELPQTGHPPAGRLGTAGAVGRRDDVTAPAPIPLRGRASPLLRGTEGDFAGGPPHAPERRKREARFSAAGQALRLRSAPPFVGTQARLRANGRSFVLSVARKGEVEAWIPGHTQHDTFHVPQERPPSHSFSAFFCIFFSILITLLGSCAADYRMGRPYREAVRTHKADHPAATEAGSLINRQGKRRSIPCSCHISGA